MNYQSPKHRIKNDSGLGRLDSATEALGFKMHSALIIDADSNEVLGFSNIQLWHHPLNIPDRRGRKYQSLPIEEEESIKWINAATESRKLLSGANFIAFVEDR